MNIKIEKTWAERLASEFSKPYFEALTQFVHQEYAQHTCYPPGSQIFRAFDLCPFDEVKVVLIGQDPYHEPGQAEGLCFSVAEGIPFPPSLRNIFQEVATDQGVAIPASGSLMHWAQQGVLLLNATLTVRAHQAGSHQGKGWEQFTDAAIAKLAAEREHLVFLLWGSYAQKKAELIDASRHLILKSPHPSPLSAYRGFFGNHHFTLTNDYLKKWGKEPIKWG
jgi:uracil-DNA glycosylase